MQLSVDPENSQGVSVTAVPVPDPVEPESEDSSSDELSGGAIFGVIFGVFIAVILIAILAGYLVVRHRKNKTPAAAYQEVNA